MKTYSFSFILSDVDEQTASAIYGKCNDSSLGKSNGVTYLAFDREAESLEQAIHSAVDDLHVLGVQPLRIEMDVPAAAS